MNNTTACQLKYLDDIVRHNTTVKTILPGNQHEDDTDINGWTSIKSWTGLSLSECTVKTRDRESWRTPKSTFHGEMAQDDNIYIYINNSDYVHLYVQLLTKLQSVLSETGI